MSDARDALAETVRRIRSLAQAAGLRERDVLDIGRLSYESGVEVSTVQSFFNGETLPEEDVQPRVTQRFGLLRATRLRPDGKMFSLRQIAESFGGTGASLTNLVNGESLPRVEGLDGIQRFFKVDDGFLLADNAVALNRALQPVLQQLEDQQSDPWAAVKNRHSIRATLARAEKLSPEHQAAVEASLAAIVDGLLTREGKT